MRVLFFLFKSKKKTDEGHLKHEGGPEKQLTLFLAKLHENVFDKYAQEGHTPRQYDIFYRLAVKHSQRL